MDLATADAKDLLAVISAAVNHNFGFRHNSALLRVPLYSFLVSFCLFSSRSCFLFMLGSVVVIPVLLVVVCCALLFFLFQL